MATLVITPEQFGPAIRKQLVKLEKVVAIASLDAAARGEAEAVKLTDAAGLVDLGLYRLSWRHLPLLRGAELRNDAPYAAVLEFGRRAGRPGPPTKPILEWVRRKLVANGKVDAADAEQVAFLIRRHIHTHGTPPKFILRDVYRKIILKFFPEALARQRKAWNVAV